MEEQLWVEVVVEEVVAFEALEGVAGIPAVVFSMLRVSLHLVPAVQVHVHVDAGGVAGQAAS